MKKTASAAGSDSLNISPIRGNLKHQITPLRTRSKMSRKDQGADVHTTCSTPNRLQAGIQFNGWNSPSDSFPYSQENRPDVIWDYTSPKLPKGSKKKEIQITVDEFLKNLTHQQVPECNTQSSHYIKLLEKWMTKQNTPVIKRPPKNIKRDNKKRSRRVIEEIKEFMESIQKKNEDISENNEKEHITESSSSKPESFSNPPNKKSFLEGDSNENDSTDELWGEVDNSFIIKATQHLDVSYSNYNNVDKNLEISSTIPETVTSLSKGLNYAHCESSNSEINPFDKAVVDSDLQAQILLTQIMNCDWESGSENDDWDNGFIEEDEALSLIPDEVLCGSEPKHREDLPSVVQNTDKKCELISSSGVQSVENNDSKMTDSKNRSEEISFGCSETERIALAGAAVDASETEIFNNFEDESFGDESVLCKPELLSWMDEIESQVPLSQLRCTPEEIEKKKDDAIQRRKNNKANTKF